MKKVIQSVPMIIVVMFLSGCLSERQSVSNANYYCSSHPYLTGISDEIESCLSASPFRVCSGISGSTDYYVYWECRASFTNENGKHDTQGLFHDNVTGDHDFEALVNMSRICPNGGVVSMHNDDGDKNLRAVGCAPENHDGGSFDDDWGRDDEEEEEG